MKAAILGTTGYTGSILLRLLLRHPHVDSVIPVSASRAGEPVSRIDAGLGPATDPAADQGADPKDRGGTGADRLAETGGLLVTAEKAVEARPDVVFAALPHLESAAVLAPFFGRSVVVDLSADFRIRDAALFERAYGAAPPRRDLISQAAYGLCECAAESIRGADIIANPGCYPTASLLPLIPLVRRGLVEGRVVINAISGISGAGRKASENLLFCTRSENAGAYLPGRSHRHWAEMQEQLSEAGGGLSCLFTPHMAPMKRGICTSIVVRLAAGASEGKVDEALDEAYGGAAFVWLRGGEIPQTRDVWGSNRCDIGRLTDGGTLLLFSVIDNLMKGASGQAVQNMNVRFGFDETAGLPVENVV